MLILRGPFYCPYHSSLEGLGHSSLLGNTYTCTVLESLLSISPCSSHEHESTHAHAHAHIRTPAQL